MYLYDSVQETVLGVVIYVLVDNLLWPIHAQRDLRKLVASSLDDFKVGDLK